MLRKPGSYDPSRTSASTRAQASNRRKTAEGPDDIIKKLLRLPGNKNCADCSARAPRAANLTHGTFVCLPCCGVHREFSHRIKGIGHSAFTTEEATFLSANGNDIINAKYLANFRSGSERLRAPDGSSGNVDGQLLRVWLRRKYIDGAWAASTSVPQQNGGGNQNQNLQPTRAQIPPKKKAVQARAPATDLLGGNWDSAPVPASVPVANDAAWDAFGQSRSSTATFQTDFGSQPGANHQPAFRADFDQMPSQAPPPAPVPVSALDPSFAVNVHQSPDPPQQQTQSSFNPNFPQPSTPNRSLQSAPAFEASFPEHQLSSVPAQQMNGLPFQQNFQQTSPVQNQMPVSQQQTTVQNQQGFNTNFQQGQQEPAAQVQQNQHGFNANFQQGQQVQQNQQGFNANFQQGQQEPVAQVQQNQQGFNANFQQGQQEPIAQVQQNQQGSNANFQQGQQEPVAQVQQNQQGFNANFQQGHYQQGFNANFQQGQQEPVAQVQQNQQGSNANFQQSSLVPQNQASAQAASHDARQMPQTQQKFNANFQQTQVQSSEPQTQVILDQNAAANQIPPVMPTQQSGINNSVHSGPADSSMHSSSAIGGEDSADPFDAFNALGIISSSAPFSQPTVPPPDPSSTPPNTSANSRVKYEVGQKLEYRDSQNNLSLVEVLKAHLDDNLVPFYDIKMENGREKQTDDLHLSVISAQSVNSSYAGADMVSKDALLSNITTLISTLNEKQLRVVEKFVKDIEGIPS